MNSHYMTAKELFENALERAKKDPAFAQALAQSRLDYQLFCSGVSDMKLQCCEFDVIGYPNFGDSEGIYGDIFIVGQWETSKASELIPRKIRVYSLKTLYEDRDVFMAMGTLVNLICYHAQFYVLENLNRFD